MRFPRSDKQFLLLTYHRVCNQINTTGVTSGAGTAYPSGAPEFIPGFQWDSCYSIFSFICMFCRSLFVLLYFFFWPLYCLFFFDIRMLIVPLVSSNSSYLLSQQKSLAKVQSSFQRNHQQNFDNLFGRHNNFCCFTVLSLYMLYLYSES